MANTNLTLYLNKKKLKRHLLLEYLNLNASLTSNEKFSLFINFTAPDFFKLSYILAEELNNSYFSSNFVFFSTKKLQSVFFKTSSFSYLIFFSNLYSLFVFFDLLLRLKINFLIKNVSELSAISFKEKTSYNSLYNLGQLYSSKFSLPSNLPIQTVYSFYRIYYLGLVNLLLLLNTIHQKNSV